MSVSRFLSPIVTGREFGIIRLSRLCALCRCVTLATNGRNAKGSGLAARMQSASCATPRKTERFTENALASKSAAMHNFPLASGERMSDFDDL